MKGLECMASEEKVASPRVPGTGHIGSDILFKYVGFPRPHLGAVLGPFL